MAIPVNLTSQIEQNKENELSYRVMHYSAVIHNAETNTDTEVPFLSYTNKYRDYLDAIIVVRIMTEEECVYYRYRPKLMSLDIYGTTDFWNDLLILNNYESIREFQPYPGMALRLYDLARLKYYLNEILILESQIQ